MRQLFRFHSSPARLCRLLITLCGFVLAGCGGAGGGGTATQKSTLPSFNNGKVGPVTAAQAAAAQTMVDNVWSNGLSGNQVTAIDAVLAQMSKLPVFRAGAVTPDGGIWGQYTNGKEVLYLTDDPNWPDYNGTTPAQRPKPVTHVKPTAGGEIAGSANAYVIVSMEPARNSAGPQIATELTAAGFNVTNMVGHLTDWTSVSDAGVLFANSHGMYVPHLNQFYQETADVVSDALDAQYATQLSNGILVPGCVIVNDTPFTVHQHDRKEGVDYHFETRYFFNDNFLTNSSMFSKNSIMVDNCCSGLEDGGTFASNLENKNGLAVYSGWTNSEFCLDSNQSSLFLFDRMLGLDQAAPIDPTNPPPATWSDVLGTMQTTTRPDRGYNFATSSESPGQASEMSFRPSSTSQLQTIIPSVATAQLDSTGKIVTISGNFGSTKGTVKFNGSYMTINSWSSSSIVVNAPTETTGVIVVEGTVTGGLGYLNSNSYKYSNITLSPHNPTLALGAKQTFTAAGQIPANAKFEWTLAGKGSIGSSASVTTTVPSITYTAPANYTTDTLTLKVVSSSGDEVGSASDTISVSSNLVLSPPTPEVLPQQQVTVKVSAAKGSLPTGIAFKWMLSGQDSFTPAIGSIGTSNTVLSTSPSITYTAPNGLGKDNLQVQLVDSSGVVEGTTSTIITTSIKLVVTPSSASVAPGAIQTFVASAAQGHIPPLPNYGVKWGLTGYGQILASADTLSLTYTAPLTGGNSTLTATLQGKTADFGTVTVPIEVEQSAGINPSSYTFNGPGQALGLAATGTFATGTTFRWTCKNGSLATNGTAQPFPTTLVTTTPSVTYMDPNPPADGTAASDTVVLKIMGPDGSYVGGGTATMSYGGTPFFVATYPYTPDNDKIITGDVSSTEMRVLVGYPSNIGQDYGISDTDGFLGISISAVAGTILAPGQSYTLYEHSPVDETGVFYVGDALANNSPPMKSGTLKINTEIPSPAADGMYIGYSINILCENGQSIVGNGVVLQHS